MFARGVMDLKLQSLLNPWVGKYMKDSENQYFVTFVEGSLFGLCQL